MSKKIKKRGNGKRQTITVDLNKVKHIVDADIFMQGLIKGIHSCKLPYPEMAIVLVKNIRDALEHTPAHNGIARWDKQNDRPHTEKFICNNCMEIAYYPFKLQKNERCGYRFCPNCGCLMDEDMDLPPAVKRVEA